MPVPELDKVPVLVTGGAGFIGSHLVDALLRRGARVRVLDNLATGHRRNLEGAHAGLELIEGDIRDLETCRRACRGVTLVFHQAALGSVPRSMEDPATSVAVNVQGTTHVFAAAHEAGVRRVVYASSSSVYGDSEQLPKREGQEGAPLSPYAWTKVAGEEQARVFGRCYGLELIGLRYFNVYGPRQDPHGPYAAVVSRFASAYLRGEAPVIHGDGEQSRDFTFIDDVVRANLLAAGAPESACGLAFNVAAGQRTTVRELAERIRAAAGGGPEPEHTDPRPGDVRHSLADPALAREHLGFAAETPIEDGLAATFEAFRAPVP